MSAQHAKLLSLLATVSRATRVLEIGTLAGYSTIALARGIGSGGQVVTLEYEPAHAEWRAATSTGQASATASRSSSVPRWTPCPDLPIEASAFDFFFIDADKENNVGLRATGRSTLAMPGAVIVVDNIARMGRVLDPAPDDGQARAVHDMFVMMGEHPRLDTAAIQTVGTKGWDGFAVAVVGPES